MSKEKENLQYSYLAEQGDLGLWNTPLNKEDNQKVNDYDKKKDNIEEKSK
jgi:hypothetical protein